ncbi:MAG: uracil-DNA glycosylase family protein [Rhodobacteraceae bacterium]|nr:uracil-DNA glycosylase family protein [Paracoccaceae bacterium]
MPDLNTEISLCRLCADRFAATATAHSPRPVLWFRPGVRVVIIGQAPGARVHRSGIPFDDPSGDRLRDWLGVGRAAFYDRSRVAIVPMAFCFPGYNAKGADLPPPPVCAKTWAAKVRDHIGHAHLTLLIGGYAQKWHMDTRAGVTETVAGRQNHAPNVFPLPHPSWRNTGWLQKNPWFDAQLLPALRHCVKEVLA